MSIKSLYKFALELESKLEKIDPSISVKEHEGVKPVSYMALTNLQSIKSDVDELLSLMNDEDDFPQWVDDLISVANSDLTKALEYIKSEKTKTAAEEKSDLIKIAAGKYDHIDFKPSESVAKAAARGLELRKNNKGKGGLNVQQAKKEGVGSGVARAVSLKNRTTLSPSTVRRMKSFFARHEGSKKIDKGETASTDKGYIAWMLWGGDAGKSWANKICMQMDAADKKK